MIFVIINDVLTDVWMSSCSVFVFLSLMEFAVVNNFMGNVYEFYSNTMTI